MKAPRGRAQKLRALAVRFKEAADVADQIETHDVAHARKCRSCGGVHSLVYDSRETQMTIRRRRMCKGCGGRWTTVEIVVAEDAGIPRPWKLRHTLRAIERGKVDVG